MAISPESAEPLAPNERVLPPPPKYTLHRAVADLEYMNWEVVRDEDDPSKLLIEPSPECAGLYRELPPRVGTCSSRDYAQSLALQAAAQLLRTFTQDHLDGLGLSRTLTPGEREDATMAACKRLACSRLADIVQNGDRHGLTGFDALLELIRPGSVTGREELAEFNPLPEEGATRPRRTFRKPDGPVEKSELLRALKLIFSTSMDVTLSVNSVYPLELRLRPGKGYQTRFDNMLAGKAVKGKVEAARADAAVLQTLVDVVTAIDSESMRKWLPEIDPEQLFQPDLRGAVLDDLRRELARRARRIIESGGMHALELWSAQANDEWLDLDEL